MLRKNWNFRNDIALQLEMICRNETGVVNRPLGTEYDADAIENGSFYEVMVLLLNRKFNPLTAEAKDFINEYAWMKEKSGNDINPQDADAAFKKFKKLMEAKK